MSNFYRCFDFFFLNLSHSLVRAPVYLKQIYLPNYFCTRTSVSLRVLKSLYLLRTFSIISSWISRIFKANVFCELFLYQNISVYIFFLSYFHFDIKMMIMMKKFYLIFLTATDFDVAWIIIYVIIFYCSNKKIIII